MSVIRKDSMPIEADEEGAYLWFDTASHGTLFLTWSKHAVPKSFMHFKPRKPVPAFKYTTNQGRIELIRDCQKEPKRYFQGWCAFVKTVKTFDGEVTLIDNSWPLKTQVCLHKDGTNEVIKMEVGSAYELSGVDAVAIIPMDNTELNAKTLTINLFKEKGERVGSSMILTP